MGTLLIHEPGRPGLGNPASLIVLATVGRRTTHDRLDIDAINKDLTAR
ncbi:hypothetical protein [Streptomyces werraensis]